MLVHPDIDPVAFSVGPLAVRWYGLMYLVGFAAAWWLGLRRINRGVAPITRKQFDDLIFLAVLGVILGGRLGYVLFYKPGYYAAHPLEIFAIWQGGMSFHGGLLGVIAAMWLHARRQGIDFLRPLQSSVALERVHATLRQDVPFVDEDRYLAPDIERATQLVRRGLLAEVRGDLPGVPELWVAT